VSPEPQPEPRRATEAESEELIRALEAPFVALRKAAPIDRRRPHPDLVRS